MDVEMSLDDIIQKKRHTTSTRGRGRFRGVMRSEPLLRYKSTLIGPPKRGGFAPRGGGNGPSDARLKIIERNRAKMTDARDKLAEIAKQSDARLKLLKLRKQTVRGDVSDRFTRNVGTGNLTIKSHHNGRISLSTKPPRGVPVSRRGLYRPPRSLPVLRSDTMEVYAPQRIHVISDYEDDGYVPVRRQLRRSIKNDIMESGYVPYSSNLHRTVEDDLDDLDLVMTSGMPPLPDIPTLRNPAVMRSRQSRVWSRKDIVAPRQEHLWVSGVKSKSPPRSRDLSMKVTVKRPAPVSLPDQYTDSDDDIYMSTPPVRKRPVRISQMSRTLDLSHSLANSRGERVDLDNPGNIHSRLDTVPTPVRTMGILGKEAPGGHSGGRKANAPRQKQSGTRIVVSNLQPNVTQEDIKELFEDVGELMESRLVRPGTAEVIFRTLEDAQQAVEVYHNRQLDGQPMKCLLVNPRSGNRPTAPALRPATGQTSQSGTWSARKLQTGTKSVVEPDIDTFHSVMFKRRA